jgi:c-di-GMP-binding flagellar brake protein YcgR
MTETATQSMDFPLNIWDKIELLVGQGDEQGIYVSRIEDINHDGIVIVKPDFVSGNKLLTANSLVYVQFLKPDALYRFSAKIRVLSNGPNGLIQLHSLGGMERVQRRQFVRVDMHLELKYALLKRPPSGILAENLSWHTSYTSNVSSGGLLMKVNDEIKKGDLLLIKIGKYEEMGIPRLLAAISRRIITMDKFLYVGVEFMLDRKISKYFATGEVELLPPQVKKFTITVQSHLVKYIFNQQIMERQKGLL